MQMPNSDYVAAETERSTAPHAEALLTAAFEATAAEFAAAPTAGPSMSADELTRQAIAIALQAVTRAASQRRITDGILMDALAIATGSGAAQTMAPAQALEACFLKAVRCAEALMKAGVSSRPHTEASH